MQRETIAVLNFGSQYDQLIVRRIRECGVYACFMPYTSTVEEIRTLNPKGIILSGSPWSVYEENSPRFDPKIHDLGIPVLGICYGMQLLSQMFGGTVSKSSNAEYGWANLTLLSDANNDPIFNLVSQGEQIWMSHSDRVTEIPKCFHLLASSENCRNVAIRHENNLIYGLQFHPEVAHSICGKTVLNNFVRDVCGCYNDWSMASYAETMISELKNRIGFEHVICALSGGVDSAVVAALLGKAIGNNLSCVLVDNGLMRQGEVELITGEFTRRFPEIDFRVINAQERFLKRLSGIVDPVEKRRIIGQEFIDVFSDEASHLRGARFLAQGTIYPDVIESGANNSCAATIKLHHNVGGLPDEMEFKLVEPLRELFKDEVRELGMELGLPPEMLWRHPFPGPGLAVRCLGEITPEKIEIVRKSDSIVVQEIEKAGMIRDVSQAFAVLLPVQSVGVMGDARTYENTIAVRCVKTDDFMTADWYELPYDVMKRISNRIVNEVRGVNRVVYDVTSKPPATIEWE